MNKFNVVELKTCNAYYNEAGYLAFARCKVTGVFVKHAIAYAEMFDTVESEVTEVVKAIESQHNNMNFIITFFVSYVIALFKSIVVSTVKSIGVKAVGLFNKLKAIDYVLLSSFSVLLCMVMAWHSTIL